MFKNILIPTDGSKVASESALAGVRLAKALGARVTAFFAAPPATPITSLPCVTVRSSPRAPRKRS